MVSCLQEEFGLPFYYRSNIDVLQCDIFNRVAKRLVVASKFVFRYYFFNKNMEITESTHYFWVQIERELGAPLPPHIKNTFM